MFFGTVPSIHRSVLKKLWTVGSITIILRIENVQSIQSLFLTRDHVQLDIADIKHRYRSLISIHSLADIYSIALPPYLPAVFVLRNTSATGN